MAAAGRACDGGRLAALRARRKLRESGRGRGARFAAFMAAVPRGKVQARRRPPRRRCLSRLWPTRRCRTCRRRKLCSKPPHKAGEAGEPALAIQLYARLLARYRRRRFAAQARAAVEAQKKKLGKA
jgi:hypothetical protein